jgi:pyrroline-5-carboxylate reductase
MMLTGRLGFLGYGNMGSAILEGLIHNEVIEGHHAAVYDPSTDRQYAAERLGVTIYPTPANLAANVDILMLAVKPQMMGEALEPIQQALTEDVLVISIAAGLSMDRLREQLGGHKRLIRAMPNTPCLAQAGATGIALSDVCSEEDKHTAVTIFAAVGVCEVVPEKDIDAVTAVSGSGPAYFFRMVEALTDAGVAEGLPYSVASELAAQTLYGAGKLLQSTGDAPSVLRERVTSPGGTTAAALQQLEADDYSGVIRRAVGAAAKRSRELGA